MENSAVAGGSPEASGAVSTGDESAMTRKEKRKILKKLKRKQLRRDMAIREKEEEEARLNDPEEQLRLKKMEEEEIERSERERRLFEERERLWIEAKKKEEEAERQRKLLEEANKDEKVEINITFFVFLIFFSFSIIRYEAESTYMVPILYIGTRTEGIVYHSCILEPEIRQPH